MLARVGDDERRAIARRKLAEGVRERRLAARRPGLGEADRALEELAVLVDEADERDGRVEQPHREARQPVERRLRRRIEEHRVTKRAEPRALSLLEHRRHLTLGAVTVGSRLGHARAANALRSAPSSPTLTERSGRSGFGAACRPSTIGGGGGIRRPPVPFPVRLISNQLLLNRSATPPRARAAPLGTPTLAHGPEWLRRAARSSPRW